MSRAGQDTLHLYLPAVYDDLHTGVRMGAAALPQHRLGSDKAFRMQIGGGNKQHRTVEAQGAARVRLPFGLLQFIQALWYFNR